MKGCVINDIRKGLGHNVSIQFEYDIYDIFARINVFLRKSEGAGARSRPRGPVPMYAWQDDVMKCNE